MRFNPVNFLKYNKSKRETATALLLSAKFRFLVYFVKPKYLQPHWGEEGKESGNEETEDNYAYAYKVAKIVNRICTKTRWESKCLVRALTAQELLRRKGIHSTMYLGCGLEDGKMVAHAWLRVGEMYVSGGNGEGYAIVDKFYK